MATVSLHFRAYQNIDGEIQGLAESVKPIIWTQYLGADSEKFINWSMG